MWRFDISARRCMLWGMSWEILWKCGHLLSMPIKLSNMHRRGMPKMWGHFPSLWGKLLWLMPRKFLWTRWFVQGLLKPLPWLLQPVGLHHMHWRILSDCHQWVREQLWFREIQQYWWRMFWVWNPKLRFLWWEWMLWMFGFLLLVRWWWICPALWCLMPVWSVWAGIAQYLSGVFWKLYLMFFLTQLLSLCYNSLPKHRSMCGIVSNRDICEQPNLLKLFHKLLNLLKFQEMHPMWKWLPTAAKKCQRNHLYCLMSYNLLPK